MTTVSARVADAISTYITDVFGLMGNGNAYFLDHLVQGSVRFTAVRHETAAVAAADAYYRASGRIAAGTATYGAGFTNTLTSLTEAVQAGIPLVLVAGDAPNAGPRPWDIDQESMARAAGARTFRVSAEDAARVTVEAIGYALNNRTAVVLAIPYDLASAECTETGPIPELAIEAPAGPAAATVAEAAALLAGARRPLILGGRGAWISGAAAPLAEVADQIGALTTTTALGRGLFPRREFDLGVAGGFGQHAAMGLASEADVVLVVGASMNQFTLAFGSLIGAEATVIRIDDAAPAHPRVTHLIEGDARLSVEALGAELAAIGATPSGWRESAPALETPTYRDRDAGEGVLPDGLLDPRSVAERLSAILPEDRLTVFDGGHFIGWGNTYFDVTAPNRLMMVGTAFQSIGLGMPSAVGATTAMPESLLLLHTGDGGGLMALADLDSVVRSTRRGVIVVWNDAAYGAEIHLYGKMGLEQSPMMIERADFAALARSFGARGDVISTLEDLSGVESWLASGEDGVYLLDCRVSQSVMAPYQQEIYEFNTRKK